MGILANSEDPDEMKHNVAFHRGLHCLLEKMDLQRKKYNIFFEIITRDPSIYTMDHHDFIVCSFMENSLGLKWVKNLHLALSFFKLTEKTFILNPSDSKHCDFWERFSKMHLAYSKNMCTLKKYE